ncbi:MAG TPA: phosphodiester glycosidase family protein, partial [Kribbella sp.]|nr:phosphodiester glycosidase family protein [Kribbella sp.]
MTTSARVFKAALGAAAVVGVLAAGMTTAGAAPVVATATTVSGLPIGDADLAETRSVRSLARGVTLTTIVRGTDPAPADQINTTTRGPWVV